MLTLRINQVQALAAGRRAHFHKELRDHLRHWFKPECDALGAEGLDIFVDRGVAHARKLGLCSERALFKYMNLALLYGPELGEADSTRWMNDYLLDEQVADVEERLNRLYSRVLFERERETLNAQVRAEFNRACL